MTDTPEAQERFRELEDKLHAVGLTPEEQVEWEALRHALEEDPVTAPFPVPEPSSVAWDRGPVMQPESPLADLVPGAPAESSFVEPAGAPPVAPPEPEPGPRPFPPADPSFDAVFVEVPEDEGVAEADVVPEVAAEDIEEIPDIVEVEDVAATPSPLPPPVPVAAAAAAAPPELAVVSTEVVEDDLGEADAVVSLDALSVTPPPPAAESLAPPLPPRATAAEPRPAPVAPPEFPAAAPPSDRDPFAAVPSFVAGEHRIVLHTVEGQVLRGSIANADLEDPELPMIQPNGAVARVPAGHVKAIFFMLAPGERPPQASGTRVRVTFGDGRQVSGVSPDYSPTSAGFFVLPLDLRTNTARVWVYRAAIRQISVG